MIGSMYLPGNSSLHKLDPRVKLVLLVEVCVILFWPLSVIRYASLVVFVMACTVLAAGMKGLFAPLKTILPLLILIGLLTPLFLGGDETLVSLGVLRITREGINETLLIIFRVTGITFAFYLYFATTRLQQFILTLRWYGLPYTAALVITLSFRYIPSIVKLLQNVRDAHKLRDTSNSTSKNGLKRRIGELQPVLTSAVIASIKLIPVLAMSLEHRGIGSSKQRSSFVQLPHLRFCILHIISGLCAAAVLTLLIWM